MAEKVGDSLMSERGNWKFSGEIVDAFDAHVSKSVPLYHEGHQLICDMSDFFIKSDSVCYEIGCSTGTLSLRIAEHNKAKPTARFIGLDIEQDMIAKAEQKRAKLPGLNVSFITDDALTVQFEPADMFVCYYTVQFVRPAVRQDLIKKIFDALNWGGALLLFEKVRSPDARFQDIVTTVYNDFKLKQGYTPEEIVSKARSLKGVLEPFSTQANIDMLKRAGFADILTVQKHLCFEGFLAIK